MTTVDEHWLQMWQQYMDFLHTKERRPSKYRMEERDLVNWVKHNRKLINKGIFKESRKEKFDELLAEAAKYQRVNQYQYTDGSKCVRKKHKKSAIDLSLEPKDLWDPA